jgi:MFS family permease
VSMLMMPTSVGVAELAARFGRVRTICFASAVTVLLVVLLVLFKTGPFLLIVAFIGAYLMAGFGDTATLANGIVGAAEDRYRGITLAVYALSGFLGGMVGPVVFGIVLDFSGGRDSGTAWSWAFGSLVIGTLVVVLPLTQRRRKPA